MSDLYGPPLSFKLVDTQNGKTYGPDQIYCNGRIENSRRRRLEQIEELSYHLVFDDVLDYESCELVQSTGLNDAAGVEIYGGDVALYFGVLFVVCYDAADALFDLRALDKQAAIDAFGFWFCPVEGIADELTVIGNRWQSQEALEARAREVLDGCLSCGANPMSDNCKASACDAELERFGL